MEEIVVMDLAASAEMAVEDNLPKPLMLSGNFHYVCAFLSDDARKSTVSRTVNM